MSSPTISLSRYYWRFAWVHVVASIAVVGLAFLYELWVGSELPGGTGTGMGVLIASAYAAMHLFVSSEGRAPDRAERWRLIGASVAIMYLIALGSLGVILIAVFGADFASGAEVISTMVNRQAVVIMGTVTLFITLLVMGALAIVYGPAARKLARRLEERAVQV